MLKHASPLRSSTNLGRTTPSSHLTVCSASSSLLVPTKLPSKSSTAVPYNSKSHLNSRQGSVSSMSPLALSSTSDKFNERGVDCDGLVPSPVPRQSALGGDMEAVTTTTAGWGIGPVITQGRAIVRRGLSFTLRREPDASSIRSVKSESQVPSFKQSTKDSQLIKASSLSGLKTEIISSTVAEETKETTSTNSSPTLSTDLKRAYDFDPLKSLLQIPGIHAEVRLPDTAVTSSPTILNPDTMSLTSADSLATSSSGRTSSRSWGSSAAASTSSQSSSASSSSSTENTSTTIRVFAKCLRSDIEYKTVSVGSRTTCGELVATLLSKYRMKHRDPNLFYLTMEVTVRRWSGPPFRSLLVLEESARPAQLALFRPMGDARFALQMRKGGVIKVHDTVLMPGSQYKSLLVSYRTTAEEVVQLMLNCYSRTESRNFYALHQVRRSPEYSDRGLASDDRPLEVKAAWPRDLRAEHEFVLRRNMSTALSLRKLSQQTWIGNHDHKTAEGRISPRSSSLSKCDSNKSSTSSIDKIRPRCHSVPTPPPRSRKNIHYIHHSLLNGSLNEHHHHSATLRKSQAITNTNCSSGNKPVNNSETVYHRRVVTHNTVNYNIHMNRLLEVPIITEDTSTLIDCTFATPIMTKVGVNVYRTRSHSASRINQNKGLSVPLNNVLNICDTPAYQRNNSSPKTITWIEKTWTTTGCQTILSYTPKPPVKEVNYINTNETCEPIRTKASHGKHVNFVDEPQIEGEITRQSRKKSTPKTIEHNVLSSVSESPPHLPSSPECLSTKDQGINADKGSSSTPDRPSSPAIPPPPLTPPPPRPQKKVAINDEVLTEPPPVPSTSPPPLTPEPAKIIKPCIKYPKSSYKSHSAPSSPEIVKKNCDGSVREVPPPVPPPPSKHSLSHCQTDCRSTDSITDDLKLKKKHSSSSCEHNCQNCFYI